MNEALRLAWAERCGIDATDERAQEPDKYGWPADFAIFRDGWNALAAQRDDGWVLVPKEPTQPMLIAAWNAENPGHAPDWYRSVYRAMLDAAQRT